MSPLAVLLQVWLGASWGTSGPAWQTHGAVLRKSAALQSPRAFVMVLNGAGTADLPYQGDNPRGKGWNDSLISPCVATGTATALYVIFAYQRGGRLEPPEADDTLRLWGLDADGQWRVLWDTVGTGRADSSFTEVRLRLEGPEWRHACFRLRWASFGSTYGAYDNWLLAYTAVQSDSMLSQPFWRAIPRTYWGRYGVGPAFLVGRNQDSLVTVVQGEAGQNTTLIYQGPGGPAMRMQLLSGRPDTVRWPALAISNTDTLQRIDLVWQIGSSAEAWTDTTAFGPWVGYDDGEMERGYGLSVSNRAFMQVYELDTLVPVDRVAIRFFPIPTQIGKSFQLGVWLIDTHRQPVYLRFHRVRIDSVAGQFVTYNLDTVLWVQGRVGVGFIQADNTPLGVGWDASYLEATPVLRDSAGVWVLSREAGCMMVRLGLVPQSLLSIRWLPTPPAWRVMPNPVGIGSLTHVEGEWVGVLSLWDTNGRPLREVREKAFYAPTIPGLYYLRDEGGRTQKLLVLP
jgi:hypothetical protein